MSDIRERAAKGAVAIICGTGVSAAISRGADGATWTRLLELGLEYIGSIDESLLAYAQTQQTLLADAPDVDAVLSAAEWLHRKFLRYPGEYRQFLTATVGKLGVSDKALERVLRSDLPVLTTNYDRLIEDLSDRTPISWREEPKIPGYHDSRGEHVFHLHGSFDDPESVILSASDYARLRSAKAVSKALEPLSATHTLLFVGFGQGLEDPNFESFLQWYTENYGESGRRLYVLLRDTDMPPKALDGKVAYLSYGATYGDLAPMLESLLLAAPAAPLRMHSATSVDPPEVPTDSEKRPTADDRRLSKKAVLPPKNRSNALSCSVPAGTDAKTLAALVGLPPAVVAEADRQLDGTDTLDPFQREVLSTGAVELRARSGVLVSAVTGTGKTTLSRVIMNGSIARGASAIMIVPTKALVSQELREWENWQDAWERDERRIRIYGSSRDYPENDSPVAKGRFEVAVAIYEKLAGYVVAGGTTLAQADLVVVDELQTLVEDKERAIKLERLLTMIRLIPAEIRPAVLGLSATLSASSTDVLRKWLGVSKMGFIRSVSRSVPLDAIVVDETTMRVQRDAHLASLDLQTDAELPPFEESRHELNKWLEGIPSSKTQVHKLLTAPLAIGLVADLLINDPDRRIIVFVPGRTAAQDLALAIQRVLDVHLGALKRDQGSNPWLHGRFSAGGMSQEEADRRLSALRHSDLPEWDQVLRGLRHGVAFHSARLAPGLRTLLEGEFQDATGLLRVLVATDTLAQGVNLPADAVIATSLSSFGSNRQRRLATPAELDNKGGRAGRRGQTARAWRVLSRRSRAQGSGGCWRSDDN